MNIKQCRKQVVLLLVFAGCLTAAGSGQTQKPVLSGPIRLDGPSPTHTRSGPIYLLSLVPVADAKPAESVWLLQKEIVQPGQPVEVKETAYKSLNATSLRDFISRLPKGADILCTTRYLPEPDPTTRVAISSYPSFNEFADFCRSKEVRFEYGIPF